MFIFIFKTVFFYISKHISYLFLCISSPIPRKYFDFCSKNRVYVCALTFFQKTAPSKNH